MDFETLSQKFHDHAAELSESKEKTAKFRAMSYDRIANKLASEFNKSDIVTKDKIEGMDISDYMKKKVLDIISEKIKQIGKKTKDKDKRKIKSKDKQRSATKKDNTKKTTREPSKSPKATSKSLKSLSKSPKKDLKNTDKDNTALLKELSQFMGIGNERAKILLNAGLKNINQLHMKKYKELLPEETKLFIDLKPIREIPHDDISKLEPYITDSAKNIGKALIVGSYRREKPTSRDIDVMLVSSDKEAIEKYLKKLQQEIPDCIYPYSKGYDKLSLIIDMSKAKLVKEKDRIYKLDVFRTLPEDEIPMLLYSTGSKEHNILMRGKAKRMGYLLNQKGLFKNGEKIEGLDSEKAYFDILAIEYKEPKNRV